jgi:hypothetical protein
MKIGTGMDIHYQKETAGYLDITFHPKWDYIAITRLYVESFLLINMAGRENIHRVSIAASELLENATKYSIDEGIRMTVRKSNADNEIALSVFNKVSFEQAKSLMERINGMNMNDSLDYYIFRMRESVKEKSKSAQLGLARIYHECQAKMCAIFDDKEGAVEVQAIFQI